MHLREKAKHVIAILTMLQSLKRRICTNSKYFLETANQEKEHAKRLMKLMNKDLAGETLYTDGNFPVLLGTTAENLKAAAAGENEEYTDMYPVLLKQLVKKDLKILLQF